MKGKFKMKNFKNLKRGSVYWVDLDEVNPNIPTNLQKGVRPAIALGSDISLEHSPVCTFIPLSTKAKNLPVHIELSDRKFPKKSYALCEQIVTIDRKNVGHKLCDLTEQEYNLVQKALMYQLFGV